METISYFEFRKNLAYVLNKVEQDPHSAVNYPPKGHACRTDFFG